MTVQMPGSAACITEQRKGKARRLSSGGGRRWWWLEERRTAGCHMHGVQSALVCGPHLPGASRAGCPSTAFAKLHCILCASGRLLPIVQATVTMAHAKTDELRLPNPADCGG